MQSQGQKRDMALKISHDGGLRFVDTLAVIDRLLEEVLQTLVSGENVTFGGFGTFMIRTRKGRTYDTGRMKGRGVTAPDKRVVRFKMGKYMKAGVTGGKKVTFLGGDRCKRGPKPKPKP